MTFSRVMAGAANAFNRVGHVLTEGATVGMLGAGGIVVASLGGGPDAVFGGLFVGSMVGGASLGAGTLGIGCKVVGKALPKIATKVNNMTLRNFPKQ